ncbi:MAG TPA: ATP-binding protein, partial [Pseudobdellovibrionaceae bacterium]
MMSLENGTNAAEDLSQIFRVAHSVKGGAAAVGLPDLCKFAHVMEDLLSVLRADPELVNSNVISLLLRSGDELKKRISSLQNGENSPWDPSALAQELVQTHENLTGTKIQHHVKKVEDPEEVKAEAPDDFFSEPPENHANLELMAELLGQMSPEERATSEQPSSQPVLRSATKGSQKPQNVVIKVDTGRVDSVLDAVGELVVLKNQLVDDDYIKGGGNIRLGGIVDQLDKAVRELYEKTLSIRMTPLKSLFVKMQRIVRDVSLSLNKPVDLQLIGEETEVERTVFELLGDPLVHLVRNAMDHGVENSQIRAERNKPAMAKVMVSAKQSGGNVMIDIVDDGGGINREKVLKKAIEKNLISPGVDPNSLSDDQVFQFIFSAGFSTADKVSDLSGRGVGLDVVRSNLERINGKINISSKLGQGTTFRLTIPLTTAITDGIVVAL